MTGKVFLKVLVFGLAVPMLYLADAPADKAPGWTLVRPAHAVVGAPLSPLSAAGVARRTTARAVTASSAAPAPPPPAAAPPPPAAAPPPAAPAEQQAAAPRPAGAPAIGTVVSALPEGCEAETKDGVEYQNCGGVYYRAAFQGNNLVYVVQ